MKMHRIIRPQLHQLETLLVGLLSFPLFLQGLSMLSLVAGIAIGKAIFPISLLLSLGLAYAVGENHRWRPVVGVALVVFLSIVLSSLNVMFSFSDGDAYHRAGMMLLAGGWNPVYQTETADVVSLGEGFRIWHVTFLPRGAWLRAAALYKWFNFSDISDSLNFYSIIVSTIYVWWHAGTAWKLTRLVRLLITFSCVLTPYTISSAIGGVNDAELHAYLLVSILSLEGYSRGLGRRYLVLAYAGLVLLSGLKYTGVVFAALAIAVFLASMSLRRSKRGIVTLFVLGVLIGVSILVFNVSPYITSTINHTSPFYPAHSFHKDELREDRFTGDFDMQNADAKEMGGVGRFCYAYVSKSLTEIYYKHKLGREVFAPRVMVFDGIEGYGTLFRIAFVLSLVCFAFIKDRWIKTLLILLYLSMILQPVKYIGYVRYVMQVYYIPILTLVGLLPRIKTFILRGGLVGAICGYCLWFLAPTLKVLPYAWLASVQNIQIVMFAQDNPDVIVYAPSYAAREAWLRECGIDAKCIVSEVPKELDGYRGYGPCARRYTLFSKRDIPDFYDYGFLDIAYGASSSDADFSAGRRAGAARYFVKEFLPREILRLPMRAKQLLRLRANQLSASLCFKKGE